MSEAAGTSPIRLSQELTIFHDVAKALTSSLNLDSILQTIMEKMAEYFRPDTWSLLMVDEEKDELYFAIAVGAAAEVLAKARLKVGEGIAGWVAKHGQALIVPDVQNDPRFSARLDEITRLQTHSVICVPLRSKHRVLGVIQLVNANVGLSEQELFFLQALCDYAAISIENARSVEKIQELTITDDCTGLFNARHLHKTLETEVYRSARFGYQFSVIFIDLDHFKQVNDTHGHLVGSRLLAEVGYLIKAQLRLIDFVFRAKQETEERVRRRIARRQPFSFLQSRLGHRMGRRASLPVFATARPPVGLARFQNGSGAPCLLRFPT